MRKLFVQDDEKIVISSTSEYFYEMVENLRNDPTIAPGG